MTERGAWRNALSPQVRAIGPDGGAQTLRAAPERPGLLCGERCRWPPPGAGPYAFEVLPAGGVNAQAARRAGTRQLFYPYPDEYRSLPPDLELLETLAAQTGGKVGASVAEIFAAQGDHGVSRTAVVAVAGVARTAAVSGRHRRAPRAVVPALAGFLTNCSDRRGAEVAEEPRGWYRIGRERSELIKRPAHVFTVRRSRLLPETPLICLLRDSLRLRACCGLRVTLEVLSLTPAGVSA